MRLYHDDTNVCAKNIHERKSLFCDGLIPNQVSQEGNLNGEHNEIPNHGLRDAQQAPVLYLFLEQRAYTQIFAGRISCLPQITRRLSIARRCLLLLDAEGFGRLTREIRLLHL